MPSNIAPTVTKLPWLRWSASKQVSVNKGLARNWQRCFPDEDIRVPDGWEHAIELNGHMVSFAFCKIINSPHGNDGEYITVKMGMTRAEMRQDERKTEPTYFFVPVRAALKPQQEESGERLSSDEWLKAAAICSITEAKMEELRRGQKIRVN